MDKIIRRGIMMVVVLLLRKEDVEKRVKSSFIIEESNVSNIDVVH
jgi:hypothetical protein